MMSTPYSSEYCWPMVFHGSLPFLRMGMKPQLEPVGDGAAEDEAARLDAGDGVDFVVQVGRSHAFDGGFEALGIAHEGRDVPEQDARLRVIRNRTYKPPQIAQVNPSRQIAGAK